MKNLRERINEAANAVYDGTVDRNELVKVFPGKEKESCLACLEYMSLGMGPSHRGSSFCRSGSIASGGSRSHCSCGTCF